MRAIAVPLLLLTIALAGCTDGGDGDAGDGFETPPMEGDAYVIEMLPGLKFKPEKAKVPVGATVVWMNEAGSHNVAPDGHDEWKATTVSGASGEHFRHTFDEAGTFDYFCQPHKGAGMVGTIRVG